MVVMCAKLNAWHARRKFHDQFVARRNEVNTEALRRIGELYAIETAIRGKPPDERRRVRQEQARPLLDAFEIWLRSTLSTVSQKGDAAKAINYALDQWAALTLYVYDGGVEIDNNAAERALRAVALGRKNFLHFGSDSGGERGAAIYTLVATANLNGLDPEAYLRHVIARIADASRQSRQRTAAMGRCRSASLRRHLNPLPITFSTSISARGQVRSRSGAYVKGRFPDVYTSVVSDPPSPDCSGRHFAG
jgi:hypothetical protein